MLSRTTVGVKKPKVYTVHVDTLLALKLWKTALKIPERQASIQKKYGALVNNGTWELVPLPLGQKGIGCKWFFCVKLLSSGLLDTYKSRLVALGYL